MWLMTHVVEVLCLGSVAMRKASIARHGIFLSCATPKHTYLNVTPRETVSRKQLQLSRGKAYVFFEYHFSWFGELVLSPVGGAAFSQAVERKRLHGKNEFLATTISRENPQRILELLETSKPKDVFMATIRARKIGRP